MTNLPAKLLDGVLGAALLLGAGYVALRFVLPWLAPFLAAFAAAALMEPAVSRLSGSGRFSRGAASALCVLTLLGAAAALLWLLCARLAQEARELLLRLPALLDELSGALALWQARLDRLLDGGQGPGREMLSRLGESLLAHLHALPGQLSARLVALLPGAAAAAPGAMLFTATAIIGAYFTSASYPAVTAFLRAQLPEGMRERAGAVSAAARRTVLRWLRAQALMSLLTFAALAAAFFLLRVDYALLLALFTAVVDALPVLGTGTVLLPWALFAFLTGDVPRGVGLAVTYVAVTMLRSCAQPKLLGDQLGLHPLATLLAIYVGFHTCGVWGMLGFPVLAIGLKQLADSGALRLWRSPET